MTTKRKLKGLLGVVLVVALIGVLPAIAGAAQYRVGSGPLNGTKSAAHVYHGYYMFPIVFYTQRIDIHTKRSDNVNETKQDTQFVYSGNVQSVLQKGDVPLVK